METGNRDFDVFVSRAWKSVSDKQGNKCICDFLTVTEHLRKTAEGRKGGVCLCLIFQVFGPLWWEQHMTSVSLAVATGT